MQKLFTSLLFQGEVSKKEADLRKNKKEEGRGGANGPREEQRKEERGRKGRGGESICSGSLKIN